MNQLEPHTFAAFADPTRLAILAALADGEKTVNELAQPFAMSQPAISQHIKVLEKAGLIARRIDGNKRPCRLVEDSFAELEAWANMMRKAFTANYNRLDQVLADMSKGQTE